MKNTRSVPQGCPHHINLKKLLAIENCIYTQFACFNIFRCNIEEGQETQASKFNREVQYFEFQFGEILNETCFFV
jgi:hypothetical protein